MKKIIFLFIATILSIASYGQADTITLTWEANTYGSSFELTATEGTANIQVDWGNGIVTTHNGQGAQSYITPAINYGREDTVYTVTISTLNSTSNLTSFYAREQRLTSLNVSTPSLEVLNCAGNRLTSLDISQTPNLSELICNENGLDSLIIGEMSHLTVLNCGGNKISSLDVSQAPKLEDLNCSGNPLTELNITGLDSLSNLNCSRTSGGHARTATKTNKSDNRDQLIQLNVSTNKKLFSINCSGHLLDSLDVSNNDSLNSLNCSENVLKKLTIGKMKNLEEILCYNNQLTQLDLNDAKKLQYLDCSSNQLEELKINMLENLTDLVCYYNLLASLDINEYTNVNISGENNQLLLSKLYPIWIQNPNTWKSLSPQIIFDTVESGEIIDLSTELVFGSEPNSKQTVFTITTEDDSDATDKYIWHVGSGELKFIDTGDFKVVMSNDSVRSGDSDWSEKVIVTIYYYVNPVSVTGIALNKTNLKLNMSDEETLTAIISPINAANQTLTWTSLNENIATVSITGKVTALTTGTTFVIATTQDGNFSDSCLVYVNSNNADLATLSVSEGALTPAFQKDSLNYKVEVNYDINNLTITATPQHDSATVQGNGEKTLIVGENPFNITVKAESDSTKTYTITVTRKAYVPSNNTDLTTLCVSEGTLTPAFQKDTLNYKVEVDYNINNLTITATAQHDSATVQGNGEKTLTVGENPFNITVKAESDSTKTYTITVTRKAYVPSNNADLATLSVSEGTLTPAFQKDSLNYKVEVSHDIDCLTITAETQHDSACVDGVGEKNLNVGHNPFDIIVTAENGSNKTYKVTITRLQNSSNKASINQTVKVYPNPVNKGGQIYIELPAEQITNVSLYDLKGNIIFTKNLSGEKTLTVPNRSGVYFLRIGEKTVKIIVD